MTHDQSLQPKAIAFSLVLLAAGRVPVAKWWS